MKYKKCDDDKLFRVINLGMPTEPEFKTFSKDVVDYPEGCVIETEKNDGSRYIEYGRERQTVNVCVFENFLYIPEHVPVARLWVRERDKDSIWYKVPLHLQIRDHNAYIMIPGGPNYVELIGDEYFDAVYELHRI